MSEGRTPSIPHTAVAASAGRSSASRWESSAPIRYPDPDIIVLDPRFQAMVLGNAAIERIATGFRCTEGPVYYGDGRYLVFSDIPNDALLRWDEITGLSRPCGMPSPFFCPCFSAMERARIRSKRVPGGRMSIAVNGHVCIFY